MNKFSSYTFLLVVAMASLFSSCDSDDIYPVFDLAQTKVFFNELNDQVTIPYTGSDIVEVSFDEDDIPTGWNLEINRFNQTVIVTGPTTQEDFDETLEESTKITISAISKDDKYDYAYLTLGTTSSEIIDISDQQSNCFIVTKPNTIYTFSAETIGENQGSISPTEVSIVWKSSPGPITYTRLVDGMIQFHIAYDEYDYDGDDDTTDIVEGNALLGAYDASGDLLWSWHIWITDFQEEDRELSLNGETIMSRNLGANDNSTYNYYTILESYGLYYQWGRKDPFVGPYYFDASESTDASTTDEGDSSVAISYEECTSSTGKLTYTNENPVSFILGDEDSDYDWLYSAHSDELWGETKTINDPCPKGWRVASASTFNGLRIPTITQSEADAIADDYGWLLSDSSGASALFMGLGRRTYLTGKVSNVNLNESRPTPWAGYYWTVDADKNTNNSSYAMYFAYDQADLSNNVINMSSYYRSNGMQVRCQRY